MVEASAKKETATVPDESSRSPVTAFVKTLQTYWFLVTVAASLLASIFYMVVFHVSPLAAYSEAKQRRELVVFHDRTGNALLGRGQYRLAKTQFERALKLNDTNHAAWVGSYMADLFTDQESPDPDVAANLAFIQPLKDLGGVESTKNLRPIFEKYIGDSYRSRGDSGAARQHYENAISLEPDYLDALDSYGWLSYSELQDLPKMKELFTRMTNVDKGDYRGYYGLGYALYMQTVNEGDPKRRQQLILEAAKQSSKAVPLKVVYLNILVDFGEIVRSLDPGLSIDFHKQANEFLDDPEIASLRNNRRFLDQFLTQKGSIVIESTNEKRAWIYYQLALDHLARYRLESSQYDLQQHTDLHKKALSLDAQRKLLRVYQDQLRVLDLLLPNKALTKPLWQNRKQTGSPDT